MEVYLDSRIRLCGQRQVYLLPHAAINHAKEDRSIWLLSCTQEMQ
jgi:xanthine dehydrogenase molybdopterin-binding subunit B